MIVFGFSNVSTHKLFLGFLGLSHSMAFEVGTKRTVSILLTVLWQIPGIAYASPACYQENFTPTNSGTTSTTNLFENMVIAAVYDWSYASQTSLVDPSKTPAVIQSLQSLFTNLYTGGSGGLHVTGTSPVSNAYLVGGYSGWTTVTTGVCGTCAYIFYKDAMQGLYDYASNHSSPSPVYACSGSAAPSAYTVEYDYANWETLTSVSSSTLSTDDECIYALQTAVNNFIQCQVGAGTPIDIVSGTTPNQCSTSDYNGSSLFQNLLVAGVVDWMQNTFAEGGESGPSISAGLQPTFSGLLGNLYSVTNGLSGSTAPAANTYLSGLPTSTTVNDCPYCLYLFYRNVISSLYQYSQDNYGRYACVGATVTPTSFVSPFDYLNFQTNAGIVNVADLVTDYVCVSAIQFAINTFNNCAGAASYADLRTGESTGQPSCTENDFVGSNFFENLMVAAVTDFMYGCTLGACTGGALTPQLSLSLQLFSQFVNPFALKAEPFANSFLKASLADTTSGNCGQCAYLFYVGVTVALYTYHIAHPGSYACVGAGTVPSSFAQYQYSNFLANSGYSASIDLASDPVCVSLVQSVVSDFANTCATSTSPGGFDMRTGLPNNIDSCVDVHFVGSQMFENLMVAAVVDYNALGSPQSMADFATTVFTIANSLSLTTSPAVNNYLLNNLVGGASNNCAACAHQFYANVITLLSEYSSANAGALACVGATYGTFSGNRYNQFSTDAGIVASSLSSDFACIGAIQYALNLFEACSGVAPLFYAKLDLRTGKITTVCAVDDFLNFTAKFQAYTSIMNAALSSPPGNFITGMSDEVHRLYLTLPCNVCFVTFYDAIVAANTGINNGALADGSGGGPCAGTTSGNANLYSEGVSHCIDNVTPNAVYTAIVQLQICAGTHNKLFTDPVYPVSRGVQLLWGQAIWALEPTVLCAASVASEDQFRSCLTDITNPSTAVHGASPALLIPSAPTGTESDFICLFQLASSIQNSDYPATSALFDCTTTPPEAIPAQCNSDLNLNSTLPFTAPTIGLSVPPRDSLLVNYLLCSGGMNIGFPPTVVCASSRPVAPYGSYIPTLVIALEASDPVAAAEAVFNSADMMYSLGNSAGYSDCWGCWAKLAAELNVGFADSPGDKLICLNNVYSTGLTGCGPVGVTTSSVGAGGTTTVFNALSRFFACAGFTLVAESPAVCQDIYYGSTAFSNLMVAAVVDWSYEYYRTGKRPGMNGGVQRARDLSTNLYSGPNPYPLESPASGESPNADRIAGNNLPHVMGCGLCLYRFYTDAVNALDNFSRAYNGTISVCTSSPTAYTIPNGYSLWTGSVTSDIVNNFACIAAVQFAINNYVSCTAQQIDLRTGVPSIQCTEDQFFDIDANNSAYYSMMTAALSVPSPAALPALFVEAIGNVRCGICFQNFYSAVVAANAGAHALANGLSGPCGSDNGISSTGTGNCIDGTNTVIQSLIDQLQICAGTQNLLYVSPTHVPSDSVKVMIGDATFGLKTVLFCATTVADPSGVEFNNCLRSGNPVYLTTPAMDFNGSDIYCFKVLAVNVHVNAWPAPSSTYTDCTPGYVGNCVADLSTRTMNGFSPLHPGMSLPPRDSYLDQFHRCAGYAMYLTDNTGFCTITQETDQFFKSYVPWVSVALAVHGYAPDAAYNALNQTALLTIGNQVSTGCLNCFARYSAELAVQNGLDTDCDNIYSEACRNAVAPASPLPGSAAWNFITCSGISPPNSQTLYQCDADEYSIWRQALLPKDAMLVSQSSPTYGFALTVFSGYFGSMRTAHPGHPFPCEPCFQDLIWDMFLINVETDITPCVVDVASSKCYLIDGVSHALTKFNGCSGFEFSFTTGVSTPAPSRRTPMPITTTVEPSTTESTTATTFSATTETTTTVVPTTQEPPVTTSKSAAVLVHNVFTFFAVGLGISAIYLC